MKKTKTSKFLEAVQKHRDAGKKEKFSGTFEQYLELIEKDESIPSLAHKRLYKIGRASCRERV